MEYDTILYEKEGATALITFNRPEKRNALNEKMTNEIEAALLDAEEDLTVKAVILTGGLKFFISGTDIEFLSGEGEELTPHRMYEMHHKTQSVFRTLSRFPKPTIAAIAGYAFGGGLELALCCDFRIAAENTKIGTPEIKLGILPGAGGTQRLSRIIGITKAKEMVLTGEAILAEEAYQFGLLNKVVSGEELMNEAKAFAGRFSNLPSFAVEIAKTVLDTGINLSLKDSLELERMGFSLLYSTEDQKEGLKAFLEKRAPKFRGK
ncbi:MAG: enoyl-CoA hydratase/isomerase family protein [Pseudomonadota bacterium]